MIDTLPCGSVIELLGEGAEDYTPAVGLWLRMQSSQYVNVTVTESTVHCALHDDVGSDLSGKGFNSLTLQITDPGFAEQIGWALIAAAHNKRAAQAEEGAQCIRKYGQNGPSLSPYPLAKGQDQEPDA